MKIQKIETANEKYNGYNVFVAEGHHRETYKVVWFYKNITAFRLIVMYLILSYLYVKNIFTWNESKKIAFTNAMIEYCYGNYEYMSVIFANLSTTIHSAESFEEEFGVKVPF